MQDISIYTCKLKRVRRGVSHLLSSTFVWMYEGMLHISVHGLVNLNISVCTHFYHFVPTSTFSVKAMLFFSHETSGLLSIQLT